MSGEAARSGAPAPRPRPPPGEDARSHPGAAGTPPGAWRLLGPALLAWACAAVAVMHPGTGAVLGIAAGAIGALLAGFAAAGRRRARRALGLAAVGCAVLVLLGASIAAGERARGDPELGAAAEQRREILLEATAAGFPTVQSTVGEPHAWVAAEVAGANGAVPVVLWIDGEVAQAAIGIGDGVGGAASSAASGAAGGAASSTAGGAAADDAVGGAAIGAAGAPGPAPWAPGTRLTVRGTPVALEAGSAAAFGVRVQSAETEASGLDRRDQRERSLPERAVAGLSGVAARLRIGLRGAAAEVPGAELVPGFAVGDASLVGAELEQRLRESSLLHLLAVSGANCALVTATAMRFAALLGAGRRARIALAAAVLGAFVVAVGPDSSVQRAAAMASVVLVSGFGGKRAVALPALGLAVLALLLHDPWQALQPGFVLSVSATAGILLLAPGIERLLQRALRVPRWVSLPVAVALAAQLACGPLLLLLQPGIPAVGVLANALAGPAAPLGTGLGLLALLLLPTAAPLGTAATALAALPARWVAATAEVTARLPLARWAWPEGWPGALLLTGVQLAVLAAWLLATRRLALRTDRSTGRAPWRAARGISAGGRALIAGLLCAAAGAFAGPTAVAPLMGGAAAPRDWSVVACDVGQGDAILLRDPARPDATMLIDTGDDEERLTACLDRFDVRRIALLVLTHDDRDHVGAAGAVLGRTDAVLVAPDNAEDGSERPILDRLDAAGVPYRFGAAGMTGGDDGLVWEVLAPRAESTPADTNAASIVMRADAGGLTVLLLADTGEEEQRALLASGVPVDADIAKAAHHGSRDQAPELATAIGAEVALVSVGADNGYGHPAAEALEAYETAGSRTLRTDRYGSIAVGGAPGSLRVWVERAESVGGSE